MATQPSRRIEAAARTLLAAGAPLVAGHSAHVFHGVQGPVLYDLGDFVDDYRTDRLRRNDLGLPFLVTFDDSGPRMLEALPLKLDYCRTRPAEGDDLAWICSRFREACAAFGTEVEESAGRLTVVLAREKPAPSSSR